MNLKELIRKENFNPGLIGLIFNPFYTARKNLYKHINELGKNISGKTIDIGCGTKPYRNLFNSSVYHGLEYNTGINEDKKEADFYYDGSKFPFKDEEYDSAVCNQVLEHVFTPDDFLKEINRILITGGKLLLTVPFVWDEHEQPFDFGRYSSFGLSHLLKANGFEIIEHRKSVSGISAIFQLAAGYLYKISKNTFLLKQIVQILLIFPINLIGSIFSGILPDNDDLYLDNVVLVKKIKPLNV